MSSGLSRRGFGTLALSSALLGVVELGLRRSALAGTARSGARELMRAAHELARAARAGELSAVEWRTQMERLFAGADVAELTATLELTRLAADAPAVERGARVVPIPPRPYFPETRGIVTKFFLFAPGRANPPHAHDNMVSMHLVLSGRFRVRHFERVRDTERSMFLTPTIDALLGPGQQTSICDSADNVHWHHAETEGALLDILAVGLDAEQPSTTHLVDPDRARRTGGLLRAPRITSVEEALERYG